MLQPTNPMIRTLQMVLIFEVVVFGLAFPGMLLVDHMDATRAGAAVGTAVLLSVLALAGLKKSWGQPIGWAVQVVAVVMGGLTSMMYAVGGMFLVIWVTSMILGKKIEKNGQTPA